MRKLFAKVLLQLTLLSVASLTLWRCAPSIYYVKPTDWEKPQRQDSTIAYYSQYIKGWKIFVDPGHGGADRFGHGPTGETEADINLRVGLALRDYLTRAGAIVFMSRTKDTTVSLLDRPKMAAEDGADIFISIHHNATGGPERYPPLNYTSTWYHAVKGDSAYTPADHDLARYVERDLAYAMGNPEPNFFSFDGTLSDYLVYPLAGFAVLRHSKIPAILTECSFFSSPYEEQRLKHDTFNEIEAWGIFKGLGKYLKAGIPRLTYSGDTLFNKIPVSFNIGYSEGEFFGGKYPIDKKYLKAEIDGKPVNAVFDSDSDRISLTSTTLLPGRHYLSVVIKNEEGNHSFPFLRHFYYVPPPAEISALVNPDTLSVKPTRFFTRVVVRSADNYNISDFVNPAAAVTNATADTTGTAISRNGIFELAALSTVGVELPSPITTFYSEEELDRQSTEIAWRILDGMLGYYGYFKSFSKSDYTRLDEVLNLPMSGGKVFSVNPYQLRLINTHLLQEYKKGNEDK